MVPPQARPRLFDAALAAVLAVGALWEAELAFVPQPSRVLGSLILVLGAAALFWRRTAPVPVVLLGAVGLCVPAVLGPTTETITGPFVLMIGVYSLLVYGPGWRRSAGPAVLVTLAMCYRSYGDYGLDAVSIASGVVATLVSAGLGVIVRAQRVRAATSEERAELAERARAEHAARAVAEERVRIARDLHDVVAHAISVIVLQARGGRRMLDIDPAEARRALDTVEGVAEQAMIDMRRMLGLIRSADGDAALGPRPSLRDLDALAGQLSRPGLQVVTRVEGDAGTVPAAVDIAAYRIVQEALTNVLRHAAAHGATVTVRVRPDAVELSVVDDGTGGEPGGGGFGLPGMRERVAVYGGTLAAGPEPGGGFAVRACLPYAAVRT